MKKGLKIILIILVIFIGIIAIDTLQAKLFNNSPIIKLREIYHGGETYYIDKGIFVNHYRCNNNDKVTNWKGTKFDCLDENSKYTNLNGDTPLTNHKEPILSITKGIRPCTSLLLVVYEDGIYELFTAYEACRPGEVCTSIMKYTKSITGKTNFDVLKIIDDDSVEKIHSTDVPVDYEIEMGEKYTKNGYENRYMILQDHTNKILKDFLKEINIDLNVCAIPEYID